MARKGQCDALGKGKQVTLGNRRSISGEEEENQAYQNDDVSSETNGPRSNMRDMENVENSVSRHLLENETMENEENSSQRRRGANIGAVRPENQDDRPLIRVYQGCFIDTSVTTDITAILKGHFDDAWSSWLKIPRHTIDMMWNEFRTHWRWPSSQTLNVRKAWSAAASSRLRDCLNTERRRAAKLAGSNKMSKWRSYNPDWISPTIWKKLIDKVWDTDDWNKKSKQAQKNRRGPGCGKAPPTHTGGSVKFVVTKLRMEKQKEAMNEKLTNVEFFEKTHKTNKGEDPYINDKAKNTQEIYDQLMDEEYSDEDNRPSFDPKLWVKASGGLKRKRVYGFGSSKYGKEILGSTVDGDAISPSEEFQLEEDDTVQQLKKEFLEEMNRFRQDLPRMLRIMLQEIGCTNHVYPGGSGVRQQHLMERDESEDNESEDSEPDDEDSEPMIFLKNARKHKNNGKGKAIAKGKKKK